MSNVIPLESPPPFMSPHMYFLPPPPPVFIGGIPLLDDLLTDFHGDSRDSAKAGGKKKGCTTPSGEGLLHEEGTADGQNDYLRDPRIDGTQPKMCKGNSDAIKGRDNDATATANGHNDSPPNRRIDGKHANTGGNDLRSGKGDAIKSCADNGRVCHAAQPREEDKQPAKKL